MSKNLAIQLNNVCKIYKLYGSQAEQILDVFGLNKLLFRKPVTTGEFTALHGLSLEVPKGQRLGIVGRNGAGKTTLLKLISGNFSPTSGEISVNGTLQALMSTGLGFHPEFTGRENIQSSLQYNGLSAKDYCNAVEDIIDFCELGPFVDQPFKTYSLGMQSRLQFACATSIKPDILIVDEILGAGDVYFSVKSSARMEKLTKSGATLVLVSHSMQQVIQFCERVIWIDGGKIVQDGEARSVVAAYEQFMFDQSRGLRNQIAKANTESKQSNKTRKSKDDEVSATDEASKPIPDWYRDELSRQLSSTGVPEAPNNNPASSWFNDLGLRIINSRLIDDSGNLVDTFVTGEKFTAEITIEAQEDGEYDCWYVILIYGEDGKPLVRHVSDKKTYQLKAGERNSASVVYDQLLLGTGEYHASVAVYKNWNPDDRSSAYWYEILNRSLIFRVHSGGPYDPSIFHHPSKWEFETNSNKVKE